MSTTVDSPGDNERKREKTKGASVKVLPST
jgi:hypothetical protein